MSFCEKLHLQQVDFREVHKDGQNPWSDKQGSVLSLRDGGHRNNHCGARQHGRMENRLERETGRSRRDVGLGTGHQRKDEKCNGQSERPAEKRQLS